MFRKKGDKKKKILILLDFENIQRNIRMTATPEDFSVVTGFDNLLKKISSEIGEISNIFVFAPPHTAYKCGEDFYELGFFTIFCPRVKDKKGREIDTTDDILIKFGRKIISQLTEYTHLCIGSGDKDFAPLAREAIRQGLKIMVIAGGLSSISSELIKLADTNPITKKKMVYIFSPTENQ
jgi:hypothetical protein